MIAADPAVAAHIAVAPADRRAALETLRDLCRRELAGFDVQIRDGMPAYVRDGEVEAGFASQKHYLSLCVTRTAMKAAHRRPLTGLSLGKGCV
jgi:hypothetical protein